MKDRLRVALGQIELVSLDPKTNLSTMKSCVEKIFATNTVDLILFPELVNTGYIQPPEWDFVSEFQKCAEAIPGYTTEALSKLSRKYHVYIIVGIAERHPRIPGTLYNSAVLIGPTGRIEGVHHKVHIPSEEKHYFYPGSTLEVYETDIGNIGMTICYDNFFDEQTTILALKGMEILCSNWQWPKPNGWTGGRGKVPYIPDRLKSISTYQALSHRVYVMACHCIGSYRNYIFDGHSAIMGPFGETLAFSEGEGKDEILFAKFSNNRLLESRSEVGEASHYRDRRPELYGMLSQPW